MTRKLDVASRQNSTSASQSPAVDRLAWTTVAAAAATSDHGSRNAPSPAAAHSDRWSRRAIQLGCLCGWALRCHRRQPNQISAAPITALTARAKSEGAVFGLGGLSPVTAITTAMIATRQA